MEQSTQKKARLVPVYVRWAVAVFVILQLVMHHPAVMSQPLPVQHQTSSIEQECAEAVQVLRAALVLMTQSEDADGARANLVALAEVLSVQRPLMYRVFYASLLAQMGEQAEAILSDPVSAYLQLKPQVQEACVAVVKRII